MCLASIWNFCCYDAYHADYKYLLLFTRLSIIITVSRNILNKIKNFTRKFVLMTKLSGRAQMGRLI